MGSLLSATAEKHRILHLGPANLCVRRRPRFTSRFIAVHIAGIQHSSLLTSKDPSPHFMLSPTGTGNTSFQFEVNPTRGMNSTVVQIFHISNLRYECFPQ